MNLRNSAVLGMLRERMSWLNARQDVLSQNVANADTPGYIAHDLKPLDFEAMLRKSASGGETSSGLAPPIRATSRSIDSGTAASAIGGARCRKPANGNTVSLEDEMIKVADTQAQYQAATNLYSKARRMLRTAIGDSQ